MAYCRGTSSALLLISAFALGCSVGDPSESFSSSFTSFGGDASAGGPGDTTDSNPTGGTMDTGSGGESGQASSSADGSDGSDTAEGPGCTPSDEVCDGEDNDCDGAIDNGNPEGDMPCETEIPGVCASGLTLCDMGALACVPSTPASAEACNGLDDDCNGMIDDGNPGGGEACDTGMLGVCADGINQCLVGVLDCVPESMSSAETCDNLDNDCNGMVDDGNPGGGGACSTGMPGICDAGTQQCTAGALSCMQNQVAAADEICNNALDDDCNAMVDDGCSTCIHDICIAGDALSPACDPCVATVCASDSFCCDTSWDGICVGLVTSLCGLPCP